MANNYSEMHIENLSKFGDIQRTYLWSIQILGLPNSDDMGLLAKEIEWQGRTMEPIETSFMGMKKMFPGKVDNAHEMAITFEEYESQIASKTLYKWAQNIFDVTKGHSNSNFTGNERADLAHDIKISLRSYNGELLPMSMMLKGAFLKDLQPGSLGYETSEALKLPVSFSYDWWEYVTTDGNTVIKMENL